MRKKKETWSLYIHKNKENGKVYVGITKWKPEKRWGFNGTHYNKQPKFWKAIQKYGWDNFEHIVLLSGLEKDEACLLEQQYIQMYDSYDNGYNCSLGGEFGWNGYKHTEETKEKIRNKLSNLKRSDEHREHLSEARKSKRPVICLETNKIYSTPHECALDIKSSDNMVLSVCRGASLTTNGFHLQYYDEPLKTIEEIEKNRQENPNKRPVICLDTGDWFESASECGKWLGTSGRNVRCSCKSYTRCKGKYVKFADDNITLDEIIERYQKAVTNKVRCIETGEIFATVKECAKHFNLNTSNIDKICKGKGTAHKLKGYSFEYIDYSPRKKKVICAKTGEIFDNMKRCADKLGIKYSTLTSAMHRKGKYEKYDIYFYNEGENTA